MKLMDFTKYRGLIVMAASLTLAGCTGDFDSMNTDPNGNSQGDPGYMVAYIQERGCRMGSWEYQVGDNLHTNLYAQYFANSATYFNSDSYTYNSAWVTDGFWNSFFVDTYGQFQDLKKVVADKPEYGNILQTARIFAAQAAAQITDTFGDVPYSCDANGKPDNRYDSQKDIYTDIFKELTEAVTYLKANKTSASQMAFSANQDLIYDGDLDKWIRLGNSLRLRYALRLAYIDAATAKKEGEAALADNGGLMKDNGDNAGVYISGAGSNGWPLFQISGWGEFCMSKTMEDILKKTSTVLDPRTILWFGHTSGSTAAKPEYKGIPNGLSATDMAAYAATDRSYVWGLENMPGWNTNNNDESTFVLSKRQKVMSYDETCFLRAEAALRGWTGAGNAEDWYLKGIQASFDAERAGVDPTSYSTADDQTYKTTGKVAWSSASDLEGHLNQIITQKWLGLYPNGMEAWAEFRRTGYPALNPVAVSLEPTISAANGEFVKKLRYPDDEIRENPNATDKSLNQGKGDGMNVRVWWDTARYK